MATALYRETANQWLQPYIERQQINGYSPVQRHSKSLVTALYEETAKQWLQPYIERQQINGYSPT